MHIIKALSLGELLVSQQLKVLAHFGHPYDLQSKDSLTDGKNLLEKDILEVPFEADKTPRLPPKMDYREKRQQSISETSLIQFESNHLSENISNPLLRKSRTQYLQKLGIPRQFYSQAYLSKQGFLKSKV